MICMKFLQDVEIIKNLAKENNQYVKIIRGPKKGSIARVVDIQYINYSEHKFCLKIDGHRTFCIKSRHLEYLDGYNGDTKLVVMSDSPEIFDITGKELTIGSVVVFQKILIPGSTTIPDMVIGTVKHIKKTSAFLVQPIITTQHQCNELIQVRSKSFFLIISRDLLDEIMLHKLSF